MKKYLLFVFLFVGVFSTAQVGIGTTDPKAMIDIPASNAATPVNTDGILIPRVANLTAAATMTADQNGMMVFLTVDLTGKPKGFYYWDQATTSWIGVGNLKGDADFYKVGTTTAPESITDDMFHSGNVAIGKDTATAKLDLEENNTSKTSVLKVQHTATGSIGTYANIRTRITGSGYSGIMVGAENTVTATSDANGVGVMNIMVGNTTAAVTGNTNFVSSASVAGKATGTANHLSGTGTGDKFGVYNLIGNTAGGKHYGVYSEVLKSGATNFAGYFLGNLGIGTTTANVYTMPASRGTANQIMQTDDSGLVTWKDPKTALNDFSWTTTGNSGTDPAVHFLGTTDDVDLVFKRNNLQSGKITLENVFFGVETGVAVTTSGNVGIGPYALKAGIGPGLGSYSGNFNTAIGCYAIRQNVDGSANTAVGAAALYRNTRGCDNSALGMDVLVSNTIGNENVCMGRGALNQGVAGSRATAIGTYAMLYANSKETPFINGNVAVGYESIRGSGESVNNTGNFNTAIGYQTLLVNTAGNYNTASGSQVLVANATGNNNTGIGYNALYTNFDSSNNTAVGFESLRASTGLGNTATGALSLAGNTTGAYNTALGYRALTLNSGSYCTGLGYNAYPTTGPLNNYMALGYNVGGATSASNMVEIGNASVTVIRGQVNFSTYSDKRIKNNIKDNVPGLSFISKLTPVTYNLDIHKQNAMTGVDKKDNSDWEGKYDIENETISGFIAQDVEAAAKSIGYDFHGVYVPEKSTDLYGLRYAEFVVPLVKAIQEQQQLIEEEKTKNASLEAKNAQLEQKISSIEQRLKALEIK